MEATETTQDAARPRLEWKRGGPEHWEVPAPVGPAILYATGVDAFDASVGLDGEDGSETWADGTFDTLEAAQLAAERLLFRLVRERWQRDAALLDRMERLGIGGDV